MTDDRRRDRPRHAQQAWIDRHRPCRAPIYPEPRWGWGWGWGLLLFLAIPALVAGCAAPPVPKPDPVALAQSRRVEALTRAVQQLQADVAELQALLRDPPPPKRPALKRLDPPLSLTLGRTRYVASPRAKATRRSLGEHVANSRGAVIAFWATWCVPCIADEELEWLTRLRGRLRQSGTDLVSVAVDELKSVRGHAKRGRWLYPLWQMNDGHLEMLPRQFVERAGLGLPLFVVVDARGDAVAYHNAPLDASIVDALVNMASSRP